MNALYIPGMRVEVRDAEWRVNRVDQSSDGGYLLHCTGQSELVRGRNSQFLTALEPNIRILDPAQTTLVDDLSSGYSATQLYLENALRQTPPADQRIALGHEAAMDLLPFQLDPVRQALGQPRQRILIADSVGLGKTLEAGILVSELIRRGRGKRILVLATKSMLGQFQSEFWQRFTIPLVRLDSVGLQRVRNRIPANHNPFHYFDRAIISIDTLKQTLEYRHHLEQAYWDIIIVDEAHNVAKRSNNSQRHQLAELLSTRSDTLIMLSATPHDGKPESFASLVNMLDATAIANPDDYVHEDFRDRGLVIRRFKHDVASQLTQSFPERQIQLVKTSATQAEEAAYSVLAGATFHSLDGSQANTGGASSLFRTTLEKALFSSPVACLSVVENRLARLKKRLAEAKNSDELSDDIDQLEAIALALRGIDASQFSRYQLLLDMLKANTSNGVSLGWSRESDDRLVIFTESLKTLDFLAEHLEKDLKLKKGQLAILKGMGMRDTDLADIVEQFGRSESPIRLLLCSDVASEGINLHHLSHRMVHFDIPWSLMVFQQRNGRIDRYGQSRQPQIRYLMTEARDAKIRGDQRILEVLIEKDEQAGKNIGDPSEFESLDSVEAQEAAIADVMDQNTGDMDLSNLFGDLFESGSAGGFGNVDDLVGQFVPGQAVNTTHADIDSVTLKPVRLFKNDLAFTDCALQWLRDTLRTERGEILQFSVDTVKQHVDLFAPADLQQRMKFLPAEVQPEDYRFSLTTSKQQVQEAIKQRRQGDDNQLANLQFLWPLHPVMEWLGSRIQDAFGRHTAPVMRLGGNTLAHDEHWFVVQGGFPNRRGQALVQNTLAVQVRNGRIGQALPVSELLEQLRLTGQPLPNRAQAKDTSDLKKLLPPVIQTMRQQLQRQRQDAEREHQQTLREQLQRLQQLRSQHQQQLDLQLDRRSDQPEAFKASLRERGMERIERVFGDHQRWLRDTLQTEDQPYIQVVAVITGE